MRNFLCFLFLLLLTPISIMAHGSHGSGIMAGFTHPIFGLDHLAAIIGLGLLSSSYSSKRRWQPVAAFLLAMVIGGLIGIGKDPFPAAELVILASVFVFGAMLAFRITIGLYAFLVLAVLFGFFHGLAHGIEMPEDNTALKYVTGYFLGAALTALIAAYLGQQINSLYDKGLRILGVIILVLAIYLSMT